jgi:hypothetical protein
MDDSRVRLAAFNWLEKQVKIYGETLPRQLSIDGFVLDEEDGPMLMHGLKGLHGSYLWIPRSSRAQPSVENLKIRYERFMERPA